MPNAPALDPAAIPGRRAPNCTLTEADWAEAMRLFLEAMWSDARIARRFNVSPSTVAAQRFKRGVYRCMRAGPPQLAEIALPEPEPLPEPPLLRAAQVAPPDDGKGGGWRTWLFLGGRGAGKTLAGAAWLASQARRCGRLALVGPSYSDVREVMIDGPSGLRGLAAAFGPEGGRPRYEPSRRRLVWPNGATAHVFTAEEPDGLRGPQFHAAWADELCVWPKASETLAQLRLGLRLGTEPKLMISTTPKPIAALRALMAEPGLVATRGSALDNAAHLSPGFVEGLRALYGGARLEAQEIDGQAPEAARSSAPTTSPAPAASGPRARRSGSTVWRSASTRPRACTAPPAAW